MWQVVYIASSKKEVDEILDIMVNEGFMVDIENTGSNNYQIKVPAIEAEDAYSCLQKKF